MNKSCQNMGSDSNLNLTKTPYTQITKLARWMSSYTAIPAYDTFNIYFYN